MSQCVLIHFFYVYLQCKTNVGYGVVGVCMWWYANALCYYIIDIMNYQKTLRIYEWLSYILIVGATVVYFVLRSQGAAALNLTLCILVVALFCRLMMERTRRQAADAEVDELREDLRKLTQLYAQEKKKNSHSN